MQNTKSQVICFIDDLLGIYKANSESINEIEVRAIPEILEREFSEYKGLVSDFFVRHRDEIAHIYKIIREDSFPYNKIPCIDLYEVRMDYTEYAEKMFSFVNVVLDLKDSDSVDPIAVDERIAQVFGQSEDFVRSLFSHEKCAEDRFCDRSINDAMRNVECLIALYDEFDCFHDMTSNLVVKVTTEYGYQKVTAIKNMVNSIRLYICYMIKEMIQCYNTIAKSIEKRTPVLGEPVKPKYDLF